MIATPSTPVPNVLAARIRSAALLAGRAPRRDDGDQRLVDGRSRASVGADGRRGTEATRGQVSAAPGAAYVNTFVLLP
jgi:hypothetical protein